MYALIDHKIARNEFNQRLQQAEYDHLARRFQKARLAQLRHRLGQALVAFGQKLEAAQPAVTEPAL